MTIRLNFVEAVDARRSDVVIVGGGLAGLSVAYAVAGAGHKVTVVEQGTFGPFRHIEGVSSADFGFASWTGVGADPFARRPLFATGDWRGVTRSVLGGRGLYWHGVLCEIDRGEFAGDPEALNWLDRQRFHAPTQGYGRVDERLGATGFFRPGGEDLQIAGQALPFHATRSATSASGIPFSPVDWFDQDPHAGNTVDVCLNSRALHIGRAGSRWQVSVVSDNKLCTCEAGHLVLAAGVLATGELLESFFATGETYEFTDHIDAGVAAFVPQSSPLARALKGTRTTRYIACKSERLGYNLFVTFVERPRGIAIIAWGTGEKDRAEPLRLSFRARRASLAAMKSERDREKERVILADACRLIRDLARIGSEADPIGSSARIREGKEAVGEVMFGDHAGWTAIPYVSSLGSTDHEGCLCNVALGFDGAGVSAQVAGLYLAGPAAMKRMGSANPNYTALAMALSLGDIIKVAD